MVNTLSLIKEFYNTMDLMIQCVMSNSVLFTLKLKNDGATLQRTKPYLLNRH